MAKPGGNRASYGSLSAFFEGFHQVQARGANCRRQSEEQPGQHGDGQGIEHDSQVESGFVKMRNTLWSKVLDQINRGFPSRMPTPPAAKASNRLSVINWRIKRFRPAPRAPRKESSLRRPSERFSTRPATFEQAISSTRLTAPNSSSNGRLVSITLCCAKGTEKEDSSFLPRELPFQPLLGEREIFLHLDRPNPRL